LREENNEEMNRKRTKLWFDPYTTGGIAWLLSSSNPRCHYAVQDCLHAQTGMVGEVSVIATFRPLLTYKTRKLRR
jgi:hypothetical protein